MNAFLGKYKLIIIGVVIFLVLIMLVMFYNRLFKQVNEKAYAKKITKQAAQTDIPSTWSPAPLSAALYKVMNGWFWQSEDEKQQVWARVLELTDTQLTALYNYFNASYLKEKKGTLIDWIEGEVVIDQFGTRKKIITRMISLGFERAAEKDVCSSWNPFC